MKKILSISLTLILLATLLTGCTKPAPVESNTPSPTPTVVQNNPPSSGSSAKIASTAVDAQGKFNGRIDGNSVEIELNPEDILAFRVTDVLDQLANINDGDMVKFSYQANDQGQLVITKIEKIK